MFSGKTRRATKKKEREGKRIILMLVVNRIVDSARGGLKIHKFTNEAKVKQKIKT